MIGFILTALLVVAQDQQAPDAPQPNHGTAVPASAPAQPADAPSPICTDLPTKANVVCTVPRGKVQIEADALNWTTDSDRGVRTDVVLYTNPTIKYGIDKLTDVELNLAPYETVRTREEGVVRTVGGVGDLYLRLKRQLTGGTGAVQVAVIPYVKAPTARSGVGNGAWEGGAIAPVVIALPGSFALDVEGEVDVLADADGTKRHHPQLLGLVNVSHPVGKATLYGEVSTTQNLDPAGTVHQYTADLAATYLLTPVLQLDAGANFGLSRETPDAQVYVGVSTRF